MAEIKYNLGTLSIVPSGSVIPVAGSTAPQGYLLCDGQAVSRTDYPYLFDAIGTTYGEGDGNTTFNLPNLQDKFIQGAGTNAVGTEKSAGLPNITGKSFLHGCEEPSIIYSVSGAFTSETKHSKFRSCIDLNPQSGATSYGNISLDASRSNSIYGNSNTVQPPSVVMNYIIKY